MNITHAPFAGMPRVLLLIKSRKIAHQAGFYLLNGRWRKIHPDKPAPKGAPIAKHPEAAGKHNPVSLAADQIHALKYPAEKAAANKEMAAFNDVHLPKLLAHAENGDATALIGHGYGSNTHGKKQAAIANFLLGQMGSSHQVAAGQKAGEHSAVKIGNAEEPPAVTGESEGPSQLTPPEKLAMAFKDKNPAVYGFMMNIKAGLGGEADVGDWVEAHEKKAYEALSSPDKAKVAEALAEYPAGTQNLATWQKHHPGNQPAAEAAPAPAVKSVKKPKAAGAGNDKEPKPVTTGSGTASKPSLSPEGKLDADLKAAGNESEAKAAARQYLGLNGEKAATINHVIDTLDSHGFQSVAQGYKAKYGFEEPELDDHPETAPPDAAHQADKPAPKSQKKQAETAAGSSALPAHSKAALDSIPWEALKLPDSNTNAKSFNKKLGQIKQAAFAGQLDALKGMKFGTNTYGKKGAKIAQGAIAALELPHPGDENPSAATAAPAKPQIKSKHWQEVASKIEAAIGAGDVPGLEQHMMHLAGLTGPEPKKLQQYVADGLAHVEGGAGKTGPQDGDTTMGADGLLVFKNGRWHKVKGAEGKGDEQPAGAEPKAIDHESIALMDLAAEFQYDDIAQIATAGDAQTLGVTWSPGAQDQAKKMVQEAMDEGWIPANTLGENVKEGDTKVIDGATAVVQDGHWHKVGEAPDQPAHASDTPQAIDGWSKIGGQLGSNNGGQYTDASGQKWYCKFPPNADVARSEVLAAKLYAAAGIAGQDCKLVTLGGKLGIASKWENLVQGSPADLAKAGGTAAGFAVDAWLGNRDVIGMGYDNLQIDAKGNAVRVDAGGSLQYRAQGGKKEFGPVVGEIDTLRDANFNPQAAAVFGKLTTADISASVAKVGAVSDEQIFDLVMKYGPGDDANKELLVETLIARKDNLLEKFPKAKKKATPKPAKPDPTKLNVKENDLPKPPSFAGVSSKEHVNQANAKDAQALFEFAKQGNLLALQDYHYDAVSKETGEAMGAQPIEAHPSGQVKGYWSELVSTLSYIAYPPEPLKSFKAVMTKSVKKVSDAFKSAQYGITTAKAAANQRLAFFIALGQSKPAEALLPAGGSKTLAYQQSPVGTPPVTAEMKSQAKTMFAALASSRPVRRFINGIQASGSYNDNFRDGLMVTKDGHNAAGMILDAYSFATEKPEGFEIYKWINFPGKMRKDILAAPPGTVFQNPGSMCCSYNPTSTAHFGQDRIRVRYAKGAKAVDSFGSGNFSSEMEITTLPGQRFVILASNKVQDPLKGERIELDVLMLPPDPTYVAHLETQKVSNGKA